MNILGIFSKKEIELLQNINIEIQDKAYEKEEIKILIKKIYDNGYKNESVTYKDAEKYMNMCERLKCITQIDIEKIKKYSKEEFDKDYYLCTIIMHKAVWNNPNRINEYRKKNNEKLLSIKEQQKLQIESEKNSRKLSDYIKRLEEKYGGNLSNIEKYFNTIKI